MEGDPGGVGGGKWEMDTILFHYMHIWNSRRIKENLLNGVCDFINSVCDSIAVLKFHETKKVSMG